MAVRYRALACLLTAVGAAAATGAATSAPANEPPVPTFRLAAPVAAGELASFDASGSSDPEGGPLTFRWSFGDGGVGDGPAVGHPFAVAGVYQVVLVVTDASGATGTALGSVEVGPGLPDDEIAAIDIEGGAGFTARPDVSVEVRGPPGAVRAELANAADFAGSVPVPLGNDVPWRLDDAGPDGTRRVFARFLGAGGHLLPGFDRADGVELDRAAPVLGRPRAHQTDPVLVCERGGAAVAGTSRRRIPVAVRAAARDRLSGLQAIQARSPLSHPRAVGDAPWSLPARPGGTVEVRAIDRVGNASAWRSARVPTAAIDVLDAATRPFTRATACPSIGQARLIRRVDRLWRAAGAPGGNRALLRPAGSHLTWTVYSGQGLFPNWVHAGTELNGRLHDGSAASYRAAVSEVVALSTLDHAGGRAFRVNENLFAVPEDGHPPPWRDAMGTGLILADLVPGPPRRADAHEVDDGAAHRAAVPLHLLRRSAPGGRRPPPRRPGCLVPRVHLPHPGPRAQRLSPVGPQPQPVRPAVGAPEPAAPGVGRPGRPCPRAREGRRAGRLRLASRLRPGRRGVPLPTRWQRREPEVPDLPPAPSGRPGEDPVPAGRVAGSLRVLPGPLGGAPRA